MKFCCRMKFLYFSSFFLSLFLLGCDKDDPAPPLQERQEVVKEEIVEAIAQENDLTEFVAVFQNVELEAAEVEEGLTVFAPQDGGSTNGRLKSGSKVNELTPEILKGHMVKGIIDALKLEDGDTLVALDGKRLYVSISEDVITINGVVVSGKDLVKQAKYVIHKVERIIEAVEEQEEEEEEEEQLASITVIVRNSTKWTPESILGEPEPGAIVSFYVSREAYAEGTPVFTGETDAAGKITFADAVAGAGYYVVVEKGDLKSLPHRSADPVDGVYVGLIPDGLFDSQEEISSHAQQAGASLGNFKWRDLNGDGIINNDDRGPLPADEIVAEAGSIIEVDVFIGYVDNDAVLVKDGEDALKTLAAARGMVNTMHKTLVMTDGILGDDAACPAAMPEWCVIDNFAFTPATTAFYRIWSEGYRAIGELNLLLRDVPGLAFEDKEMVLHQALGLRAYVYLELAKYFGGIPIVTGTQLGDEPRATLMDNLSAVRSDLESIIDLLPVSASSDQRYVFTSDAARVLLARIALLEGNYNKVAELAETVINGMRHGLTGTRDEVFVDATNSEIIWDFSSTLPFGFQEYFYDRSFCPAIRLAEVYLLLAEAQLENGELDASRNNLNVIRGRAGMEMLESVSSAELRTALQRTWKEEMSREGNRFFNIVRWEIAQSVLADSFNPAVHSLFPIPMVVIDQHPNIFQNPGY